jgi:hypothetical protein
VYGLHELASVKVSGTFPTIYKNDARLGGATKSCQAEALRFLFSKKAGPGYSVACSPEMAYFAWFNW